MTRVHVCPTVLEGLVKFEMRNFSRLALIVTSQSRSTLHPSIVASRGLHFVQEVTAIKPPDKVSSVHFVSLQVWCGVDSHVQNQSCMT